MSQITVTVVRADTNQEYEVELPDDAKLDDLLPQLVQQLGLPLVGPDGNRISYQLSNKRTSQELKQNKTLGEYATKSGDLLLLTSTFVAGLHEPHVRAEHFCGKTQVCWRLEKLVFVKSSYIDY